MDDARSVAALHTIEGLLYHRHKPSRWLSTEARSAVKLGLGKGYDVRIVTRANHNTCLVEIKDDRPGTGAVSFYTETHDPIDHLNQHYNQMMSNWKPAVVITSEF